MKRRICAALALAAGLALAPAATFAADAVRVQADGVAKLPPFVPGAPAPKPPTAEALRALRQLAVANGVETAVLAQASELAREDVRGNDAALRAALGTLADYTLGHGVLADLGAREAKPKGGGAAPRKPGAAIPMEHAWRVEALVDGARVLEALRAAGLAVTSDADGTAVAEVVLEAPYEAAGYAALRARLAALGALSVVPRRFSAEEVSLVVRGLPPEMLRQRLETQPPTGYQAEASANPELPTEIRVRLIRSASSPAGSAAPQPAKNTRSD